jgi:hypothetical protein
VLTVVEAKPAPFERASQATEARTPFEDDDLAAQPTQLERGCNSCDATADHGDASSHRRAIRGASDRSSAARASLIFVEAASSTRVDSAAAGSRAMRSRSAR